MPWPTPQDYNEAVQNPHLAFTDSDLRAGQPELTPLGLPRPISGGFACVYKIQSAGRLWAARCFMSEVSDQQRRYDAISRHLATIGMSYSVPFSYLPSGIMVQGNHFPLLKMEWVQGESLSSFVGKSLGYPDTLLSLAKAWVQMVADLQSANIAHGDLQHGNVLVVGDRLRLIDYDGMFVPTLAGNMSRECGHRNYQHPARTEFDYGLYLDNFSAWVIYLSLVALAVHPELWSNHHGGDECLLFRKEDFLQPGFSALLRDINRSSNIQLRSLAQLFRSLLNFSPQDVPSLDGIHSSVTAVVSPAISLSQTGSSWWDDHVEGAPASADSVQKSAESVGAQPTVQDLGWILESQDEVEPVEPLRFKGSMRGPRGLLVGSFVLVFITGLLVGMPSTALVVASCGVFGLNLLVCFLRYKSDPTVPEFAAFKQAFDNLLRQVRAQQAVTDSLLAERGQIHEKLAAVEKDSAAGKARSQVALQSELKQTQAKLDSALQRLDQRRRETVQVEANELQAAHRNLGDQVAVFDRKLSALTQKEAEEKDKALRILRDMHVLAFLRQHLLSDARISGFGPTLNLRLKRAGITSAADIDHRVFQVEGIGGGRYSALLTWRTRLESEAKCNAPSRLPSPDAATIENRFIKERQALEAETKRLQAQLFSQIAAIRQRAATARQALNQEDQQAKDLAAQEHSAIHQSHNAKVAALEKRVVTARNQVVPAIAELSDKLRIAQKQIFALHWQSAKQEREGQRFVSMRFQDYLKSVAGL